MCLGTRATIVISLYAPRKGSERRTSKKNTVERKEETRKEGKAETATENRTERERERMRREGGRGTDTGRPRKRRRKREAERDTAEMKEDKPYYTHTQHNNIPGDNLLAACAATVGWLGRATLSVMRVARTASIDAALTKNENTKGLLGARSATTGPNQLREIKYARESSRRRSRPQATLELIEKYGDPPRRTTFRVLFRRSSVHCKPRAFRVQAAN